MHRNITAIGRTSIVVDTPLHDGETIESKIDRMTTNKEPITDSSEIIYQERSEGINPGMDIRTDRFDLAIDAMDAVTASKIAKREYNISRTDDVSKTVEMNPTETQGTEPAQQPAS